MVAGNGARPGERLPAGTEMNVGKALWREASEDCTQLRRKQPGDQHCWRSGSMPGGRKAL